MSYKVDLLNKTTLAKIKDIEIVNEPEITEEINGSFTLNFDAHYSYKNDFTNNVLINVDGKYFSIAKVTKSRDDSITLSVYCEHVSYELIVDFEISDELEFESDAQTMINEFLQGTRFSLVSCIQTDVKYYKTKTLDIRKRLFEVANLFGGEFIFDNFNISLVQQRGSDKGLDIELGINLLGVTEETDFVEGKTSYELDLLDLSHVNGYETDFSGAEIGDTITIRDRVLGINTNERIISIRYNPFKRALPTVIVGEYIRDFTEYLKYEEEEEEEEEEGANNYLLEEFKIGNVDCLELSGVELSRDEVLPDAVSATIDFTEYEKLTGVQVRLKQSYSSYYITIYKISEEDAYTTLNYSTHISELSALKLPNENITAIGVLVTEVPFSEFDADKHKFGQYGVKFDRKALDVFREVRVGKVNALKLEDVALFPPVNLPDDIKAAVPYEDNTTLTGLFVSMKEKYKSWYVKVTTFDDSGTGTEYNLADIEATAKTWVMPSDGITSIALTAMEKPPAQFVDGQHAKQTIAFEFLGTDAEIEGVVTVNAIDVDSREIISSVEMLFYEVGEYEIHAEEVEEYKLISESPILVELTKDEFEKVIEFEYEYVGIDDPNDPTKDRIFLEYGAFPLANTMELEFQNGPYDEIKSIVTGVSFSEFNSNITSPPFIPLAVQKNTDDDGMVQSLTLHADGTHDNVDVNFQIVCLKRGQRFE